MSDILRLLLLLAIPLVTYAFIVRSSRDAPRHGNPASDDALRDTPQAFDDYRL